MCDKFFNNVKLIGTFWCRAIAIPQIQMLMFIVAIISYVSASPENVYTKSLFYEYFIKLFALFMFANILFYGRIVIQNEKVKQCLNEIAILCAYILFIASSASAIFFRGIG